MCGAAVLVLFTHVLTSRPVLVKKFGRYVRYHSVVTFFSQSGLIWSTSNPPLWCNNSQLYSALHWQIFEFPNPMSDLVCNFRHFESFLIYIRLFTTKIEIKYQIKYNRPTEIQTDRQKDRAMSIVQCPDLIPPCGITIRLDSSTNTQQENTLNFVNCIAHFWLCTQSKSGANSETVTSRDQLTVIHQLPRTCDCCST